MEILLYLVARGLIGFIQALPITWAARLGRFCGAIAYIADARHRKVAQRNLTMCFGKEKSPKEIKALAKENFRRIGENIASAIKTASMTFEELKPRVEFDGAPYIVNPSTNPPNSIVAAIGHFGNFELYARFGQLAPSYKCATTYRALRQLTVNRLLQSLRERSGCQFFERRFDAGPLKTFMHEPGVMLGLLSDQSGGAHGLRLPFLGHECSTSPAVAIFALRYNCRICVGICYRVGLAKWRIEDGEEVLTHENGVARPIEAIMRDVNAQFEAAVRRDPANWFWVHNRWKLSSVRKTETPAGSK